MEYVASTVIVGPHGELQVTRGYTEIGGVRFYDDQVVVGSRGEYVLSRGKTSLPTEGLKPHERME